MEEPPKLDRRGSPDRLDQVGRGFFRKPLQRDELILIELEQVGQVGDKPLRHEKPGGLLPETLDVESATGRKVLDAAGKLGVALEAVETDREWATLDQLEPARRAVPGHTPGLGPLPAGLLHALEDLRDHVTRPLDPHTITLAYVLAHDLLTIVEARPAHRHPTQLNRPEHDDRRDDARTPDARHDAQHARHLLAGGEFVRESPTWVM